MVLATEKRSCAARRHSAAESRPAARIASAISSTVSTMNPVLPCSTISGSAPRRNATTGVPEASASSATSEQVSGTRLVTSTQRATARRRRFCRCAAGPTNRRAGSSRGRIASSK